MLHVTIAPIAQSDAEDLIAANIASRAYHAPWAFPFVDRDGFDVWFGQTVTGPNIGLVARDTSSGGIVGVVNISQMVWGGFRSAFLGYHGMVGFAGRGFMTEALRLAIVHAFDTVGLHRLEANIQPANQASIALVQRLGFRMEGFSPQYLKIGGVWCDHERWALLADDPRL
ncbi:GNAT family N-acetyltransferase [Rhizobium lusitanum]|uniref:GNAT family N-acetyltransferase n=1 Tax=Rhizobium lusitanum TaxID=293958 RepID=UPI00160745C5|nr:GNAT family protein [Rhizobium lusitanum]QND47850.1 GNAT family N-acetyltransferase [Rhizobium lusitanum]